jgi:hypothetical protein
VYEYCCGFLHDVYLHFGCGKIDVLENLPDMYFKGMIRNAVEEGIDLKD